MQIANLTLFSFQDLFFKYSLNNFLHSQVKECIRLVFAWNSALLPPAEPPKSPLGLRVKTPPTVEMIDPQGEDTKAPETTEGASEISDNKKDDLNDTAEAKDESEAAGAAVDESEAEEACKIADQNEQIDSSEHLYDNPLLIDVSISKPVTKYFLMLELR